MDSIFEAYKNLNEEEHNQYAELEELILTILKQHDLPDLKTLGKEFGQRIASALEEAFVVAPQEDKKAFKESVTKGMK